MPPAALSRLDGGSLDFFKYLGKSITLTRIVEGHDFMAFQQSIH